MAASASGLRTKHMALVFLAFLSLNEVGSFEIGDHVQSLVTASFFKPRPLQVGDEGRVDRFDSGEIVVLFDGEPPMKGCLAANQLKKVESQAAIGQPNSTEQANQQGASASTACVPGDWCPFAPGWYQKGWSNNKKKCCINDAYITHEYVDNSARCQSPMWESISQRECCTTQWAYCESDVEEQYCTGDEWMLAANKECCTTSLDYEPEVKCYSGWSWSRCTKEGDYKYLGPDKCCAIQTCMKLNKLRPSDALFCKKNGWDDQGDGKCCTSKNFHCEENVPSAYCTGAQWKYFGNNGKCCTTIAHESKIQCAYGYTAQNCYGKYTFLGNGKCCWEEPVDMLTLSV